LWRRLRFRRRCTRLGNRAEIGGPCFLSNHGTLEVGDDFCIRSPRWNRVEMSVGRQARLRIGDRVFFNQGVRIACSREIAIGNDCQIGDECVILDQDYHARPGTDVKVAPVVIEEKVWLATRVIVLRGVTIGRGSVVGAGSVVTRSIPPNTFAAGVPARLVKRLDEA
jgi:maltose O-acetyltransferase